MMAILSGVGGDSYLIAMQSVNGKYLFDLVGGKMYTLRCLKRCDV
jgi:hypothetical protein